MKRFPPINEEFPHFFHGGDYNPDQWKHDPAVWDEDVRLMKLAQFNAPSVGVFQWAQIEPQEGQFDLNWLDRALDTLVSNDIRLIMATPSAAPPAWMYKKYPEMLRTGPDRRQHPFHSRVNYCLTSSIYREKCHIVASTLAERYKEYPILLWHINNEMAGFCYCPLCQQAFRRWLQDKYGTLQELNRTWWSAFWSHTYYSWDEIEPPGMAGGRMDQTLPGLTLDYRRFMSHQQFACYKNEAEAIRAVTPNAPVTTNTWRIFGNMDWRKFAADMDVMAIDNYPWYHGKDDWNHAVTHGFGYDIYRAAKGGKPFVLMETSPGIATFQKAHKLKRPGLQKLIVLQAIAHGADAACYFQWRSGQGGNERFHGAIVDQNGHENTRTFRDIAEIGALLTRLDPVVGTSIRPQVGLLYDMELEWAIPQNPFAYRETCHQHYKRFWQRNIAVDVVNAEADFRQYKLLVAPQLYLLKEETARRLEEFVAAGGTLVTTYFSGIVNENELCYTGGYPGPLRKLLGLWNDEIDILEDGETVAAAFAKDNSLQLEGEFTVSKLCALLKLEGAQPLAFYRSEFYADTPCLTVHPWGQGKAYYLAARGDDQCLDSFYTALIKELDLSSVLPGHCPRGVTAHMRTDGKKKFIFLLNFTTEEQAVSLDSGVVLRDVGNDRTYKHSVPLPSYGSGVYEWIEAP